jgi:IMP dehydrogenase
MDFTGKTFDDFLLKPHLGIVKSRQDVGIRMKLAREFWLDVPVMAANMNITGHKLAVALAKAGGVAVLPNTEANHRTVSLMEDYKHKVGLAISAKDVLDNNYVIGGSFIIIDMAHGHSVVMKEALQHMRKRYPNILLGAGNVATAQGAYDLTMWGADFVKVGIGPGSACLTRLKTAAGVPQLQAIYECSKVANVIADGGTKHEKDIFLALACGAKAVMMGGYFAGTDEANTEAGIGRLQGLASREAQPLRSSPPEGYEVNSSSRGSILHLVRDAAGYLRSSVSYAGYSNLADCQRGICANPGEYLIPISAAAQHESFYRP